MNRYRRDSPPTVPAEFWSADPMRKALQAWHIGKVVAAYRAHEFHPRPLSQELVAGWLGMTQAQLSRIENGEPVQDLSKLIDWARLLNIPAELLWFKLPGMDGDATNVGASPSSHTLLRLTTDAATESLFFARSATETGLASDTLDQLRWEIERLAADYVHAPLQSVFADLINVRNSTFDLLRARHRPSDARELYFLAGVVCDLLAQSSNDAGNPRAARTQLRAAWTCAQLSDHDPLRAWIHGTASLVEDWADNPEKAIQLAVRGRRFKASRKSRVRLAAMQARAAARSGHHDRVNDALVQLRLAEDARHDEDDVVAIGGTLSFPEAKQHYYLGRTYGLIGKYAAAEEASQLAIKSYRNGPTDERSYGDEALAQVDVVNARLATGDLEGADQAIAPIVELPVSLRIGPIDSALDRTRVLLDDPTLAGAKVAGELRERLTTYQEEIRDHRRLLASAS
jgi:transcriptional regulator with XRE-family HTH domain